MNIFKAQKSSSTVTDFTNYSLFIPSISVGNVGQLAIDLLISSLDMQKAGILYHAAIIGYVGPDPFDVTAKDVCTACDIYYSAKYHVAALQIRSGFQKELICDFFADLCKMITEMKFQTVFILTSCYAFEKVNVKSTDFLYFGNSNRNDKLFESLDMLKDDPATKHGGCGYSSKLYEMLDPILDVYYVLKFVSEGDNRNDAEDVYRICLQMINGLDSKQFVAPKIPVSWQFLFGDEAPNLLY